MGNVRVNQRGSVNDLGSLGNAEHNAYAGAKKTLNAGPDFQKQGTNAFVSGQDASVAGGVPVSPWSILWFYNNSASTAWVALSTATPSTPSSFATGVPLPPNSWSQLSAGPNSFCLTSSSNVGLYVANDDTNVKSIDANA